MGRRRTPTYSALEEVLISSGIQPDRHMLKRLLWDSASNVIFADGQIRRKKAPGLAYNIGNAAPIRGLGQLFNTDGGRWLYSGAGGRIAKWAFGAPLVLDSAFGHYVADATATQRPTVYDFTPYGNWMIVNDGYPGEPAWIDKENVWTEFAAGEAPAGAVCFLKRLSFLLAIGYGTRGTRVGWSDANNIEVWTATSVNTAGSISIDDFNTPIRAGSKLGSSISVFSEDQMALVNYIGAPFIFGQSVVIDGIGAIGKAAVASDMKQNVGLGRAGAWWTDSNSARYIDEGFLANYLQDNVNWDQAAKSVVGRNDYTGTFEFHMPMRDSEDINEGWAWDPKTGGWSPVPPLSFLDERRLFNFPVGGSNAGLVQLTDFDAAANTPLVLTSKPLVMQTEESPHVVSRVDEVDILLHEAAHLEFRLGCAEEPNGDYDYCEWMEAVAGNRVYEIPELPEQPYWKVELRSEPGYNDWAMDLQGFILYGVATGVKM